MRNKVKYDSNNTIMVFLGIRLYNIHIFISSGFDNALLMKNGLNFFILKICYRLWTSQVREGRATFEIFVEHCYNKQTYSIKVHFLVQEKLSRLHKNIMRS